MKGFYEFNTFVLGCDHAGYDMKEQIKEILIGRGYPVIDVMPEFINPIPFVKTSTEACKEVLRTKGSLGILFCGTGVGMSIAANRIAGIKAAILYDDFTAEYSRRHNNANVIVFGSRTMDIKDVEKRIDIFLSNRFEGGKYEERNLMLDKKV